MIPKIEKIETFKAAVPLKEPFKTALRTVTTATTVIVKVTASNGMVGFGEAAPTPVITGDTTSSIIEAVEQIIGPKIVGESLLAADNIKQIIDQAMVHNSSPKAALNIAVNDLLGQIAGLPLYQLLGGARDQITTDYTVSVGTTDSMIKHAKRLITDGFTTLKIKVGSKSEAEDLQTVVALRKAVGPDINIRLDANQGWHPKQAIAAIRKMEQLDLNIELVEQPVPAADFDGLASVTNNVLTPIMADEGVFSVGDALRLIEMKGCDIINLKLMKAGGIDNALKINAIAEAAGVKCMVGSMIESSVSVTAAAHLAAAKQNIQFVDLDAAMMFTKNPVDGGILNDGNIIKFSEKPGLGF
ncbi:dipeptide epimerase [Lentilactobacillus sp. Marseille-Q4993]|uniref:mandelate racemase/muconate lactonizing enzyme family protein n=1 Tax=Lentilactobacillus sp. Marseille-Q4993 TaxID=3039492 RepID=UPI0024BD22C3|nr:dipeptide epimerase [Lentilactobacillus sp. Marseille-Q4993]